MDFSFSYSPFWLLLIVPAAAALSWWMYVRTAELLSKPVRWMLTAFRFTVLVLLGILLLEPLLSFFNKVKYPPTIAVLQDESESIGINRDSTFLRKEYPKLLGDFLDDWDSDDYTLAAHRFSDDLKDGIKPDSLRYTREGTDIASALEGIQDRYQTQNLGAIVLLSDGIPTGGANPLYALENIKQPIFTVLLGDTTVQRDVRIRDVLYNEIAYLNNETPIRIKAEADGYDAATVSVTLRGGGKTIGTKNLTLSRNKPSEELEFMVMPEKVGLQEYVVEVSRMEGEITYKNNVQKIYINVLENRVKIALFAGSPHPDLGALRDALKAEKAFEIVDYTLKGQGVYYEDISKVNFADIDLFVLHNFPYSAADAGMTKKIAEEIAKRNVPAMFFVGTFANLQTMSPLYQYMAIAPKSFNPKGQEVIVNMKESYTKHATYTFAPDWLRWMNAAPPVYRNASVWEAKPTAEVFATAKIKNIAVDYPVYALQEQLGRKNMTFLGDNFWRIRAHSYLEHESFDYFDDWIFNNIKWLMAQSDKRKFKVTPSKQFYTGSEPVFLRGEAYNDSYDPISGVEIKLTLTSPDGKSSDYFFTEQSKARYALELYNLPEGAYRYKAVGKKDDKQIGTDEGTFSIGKTNIEHLRLRADKDLMQQIALRTGGQFIYARNLPELAEKIKALPNLKPIVEYRRDRRDFHHYWWLLLLLLGLLSVEWIVRKWNSLL